MSRQFLMKQSKTIICLFFSLFFLVFDSFAIKKQNRQTSSFFHYATHPTSLFCTGFASLGGYCWYDKESTEQAYAWLKQRFDEVPSLIKLVAPFIGFFGFYTFWYYKKEAAVRQQKVKNNSSFSILWGPRVSKLEENEKKLSEQLRDKESAYVEYMKTFVQKKKFKKTKQSILQLEEEKERSEQPKQTKKSDEENANYVEHVMIPKDTLINWANRLRNLEIILEIEPTQSFGNLAELKPDRLSDFEKRITALKVECTASTNRLNIHDRFFVETTQEIKGELEIVTTDVQELKEVQGAKFGNVQGKSSIGEKWVEYFSQKLDSYDESLIDLKLTTDLCQQNLTAVFQKVQALQEKVQALQGQQQEPQKQRSSKPNPVRRSNKAKQLPKPPPSSQEHNAAQSLLTG